MKKKFGWVALTLAAFVAVPTAANAQYSRRDVAPPVAETEELDPSTPIGKVREIAARLESIESTTEEIGRALEANKLPEYKASIDKILEASGATRAEVARLGEIASGVNFAVAAVEANTKAIETIAGNVDTTAKYLRYVPTGERLDAVVAALEKTLLDAVANSNLAQTEKISTVVDEKIAAERAAFAEYRAIADADATALKNKLETASNIIILLGLGILALFVVNVAKFVYDKAQQAKADRERRDAEIRELVAATGKAGK